MRRIIATITLLFIVPLVAAAQGEHYQNSIQGHGFFAVGGIVGCGCTVEHVGFGADGFLYKGVAVGLDAGYAHWGPYDEESWIASGDLSYHFGRNAGVGKVDPYTFVGITGEFPADEGRGNAAVDFGVGATLWLSRRIGLRLEGRDYATGGNELYVGTHLPEFRIGFTFR